MKGLRWTRIAGFAIAFFLFPVADLCGQTEYDRAAAFVRNGDPSSAMPLLEGILAAAPRDLKARNLLGIALLTAGRKEEAVAQFREALAVDPDFLPALKNIAVNEMALGRQQDAEEHFDRLLRAAPNDPVAHLYLAEICFGRQDYPCAVEHYERSGALETKDPQVGLRAARSAMEQGETAIAVRVLRQMPEGASEMQFEAGLLLAKAKEYPEAARHFELAAKGYPDPYQAGFNLTLVYVEGHDAAAAIRTGEALVRRFPKSELYNLLARAYEGAGQTEKAYDALRTAAELDPSDETNYVDLMSLCLAHENWDLSLEISDIALARIPSAYRVRMQRGAVLAMKGRLDAAETEFATAARQAPESALPAVALAVVKLERKQPESAVEILRTRRAHHGGDYRVDWLLGEALMEQGSDDDAIPMLREAAQLNSGASTPRVLLGKLLVKKGETEAAARCFEEALKLDPNDHTAAYQLAVLYRKAGRMAEAQALMETVGKAVSAPESSPSASRELVRILRDTSR